MAEFLQQPGMDWVRPAPMGDMMGQSALAGMPGGAARGLARSLARERLNDAQVRRVEAQIGRIHALTQSDLRGASLGHEKQRRELDYLKERYPLLVRQLEQEIEQDADKHGAESLRADAESAAKVGVMESQAGVYDARTAQIGAETEAAKEKAAAELRYLEQRYPGLLRQIEADVENARNESEAEVGATNALASARQAAAASTAAEAAGQARIDAETLRQLQGRYPGVLEQDAARLAEIQAGTAREDAESAATVGSVEAQAAARRAQAAAIGAGAADDARMQAEELAQLRGRYPGMLDRDAAELAGIQADTSAAQALAAQRGASAAAIGSGAAGDARIAAEELAQLRGRYPHLLAQDEAGASVARTQADMERERLQSIIDRNNRAGGGGAVGMPGAAPDPLNPYSAAGNRFNDDIVSLVKTMYGPNVLTDPVDGQMMLPTDPGRQHRQMQIIRAAQNLAAVSLAAGQPLSPQQAVGAAIDALRSQSQPGPEGQGVLLPPGGGAPAGGGAGADPLGIRGGT